MSTTTPIKERDSVRHRKTRNYKLVRLAREMKNAQANVASAALEFARRMGQSSERMERLSEEMAGAAMEEM